MAEPAEVLLIKDQYESAFSSLSRGLAAEEAENRTEALVYYRKGKMHLTQGIDVPTGGERQQGAMWDAARQLQQRMRATLGTVNTHLSALENSQLTTGAQRGLLLKDLPPNLYPDLAPNSQPPNSSTHHLYPTIPATSQNSIPTPKTPPPRPPSPAVQHTLPAAAPGPTAMDSSGDQPPVYTLQPTNGHRSLAYGPSGGGLGSGTQAGAAVGGDGVELLSIPSGVQLFFVAPNGQVSSLSSPGYLRIIMFDSQPGNSTDGRSSAFLHVCDCLYPLTADTPVLLANSGIFMFPDTLAETPGSFVGLVLSSELPPADRQVFQDVLSQLTELRIQGPDGTGSEVINLSAKVPLSSLEEKTGLTVPTGEKEKPLLPGWSEKMAQGIASGSTWLSQSFAKGAEATGKAIQKGAAKIRDHITPEDTPSEVSPHVSRSLQVAKQASGGAVRVSRFLVNGVSTVAAQVADKVVPHVKKQGTKLVPESLKKREDGRPSNLDGAKFVASSGVHGFTAVWSSLETGAKLVCKSVATETVTTVKYKYGDDAGQATDTALKSVGNVGLTAFNIDNLGVKAILKTFGKKTAKAMVKSPDGQPADAKGKEEQKQEHQANNEQKNAQKQELQADTDRKDVQKKEEKK